MINKQLLASVALFRELYDNNKDIYDVITEFIRAAILLDSRWSFNSVDCTNMLETTFGFKLPEAVVKTCLKNRMKPSGEIDLIDGMYTVSAKFDRTKSIQSDFKLQTLAYEEITNNLIEFVRNNYISAIEPSERLSIIESFNEYLLGEYKNDKYTPFISHYIFKYENNNDFKLKLNRIEEGLVLITGIKYSSDLNFGAWPGNLTIFLDVEHLFSAVGLNGILYKKIFEDFYNLVKEINLKRGKNGKITLSYFEEIWRDVENFFFAAEKIVENHSQADPSKTAMISIVNGCKNKSDVIEKKVMFEDQIKLLNIQKEEPKNYYDIPQYNVESSGIISNLMRRFNHQSEPEKYSGILKLFTKINYLRKGSSNVGIENVSAIFMTANGLTHAISLSEEVYPGNGAIPFATDIDFMTEKFWFKLNKGFGVDQKLPSSFNALTKAQLVLSSQVNNQVSTAYRDLVKKHDSGELTNEQAGQLFIELRKKPTKPEDFTSINIEATVGFLKRDFIDHTLREISLLRQESEEGRIAKESLRKLSHDNHKAVIAPIKRVAIRQYYVSLFFVYVVVPILCLLIIARLYSGNDTALSIILGILGLSGFIFNFFNNKKIKNYFWRLSRKYYKLKIKSLSK